MKTKTIGALSLITFSLISAHYLLNIFSPERKYVFIKRTTKTILVWNKYLLSDTIPLNPGQTDFIRAQCPVSDCIIWNHSDGEVDGLPVQDFDAIIFKACIENTRSLRILGSGLPAVRRASQRYVFYSRESPMATATANIHFPNFFNWTMTYRMDSDIWNPYGVIVEKSVVTNYTRKPPRWMPPDFRNIDNVTPNKKLVAWMASNCVTESRREWYVAELSKYVNVDVYGYCGTYHSNVEDSNKVINKYKFYLAFENSLCDDYVTEKFFKSFLGNAVPIAYGGDIYKKIAPPMSYIDVRDFQSPSHLAEYLVYLDENPEQYQKYFWWKSFYRLKQIDIEPLCELCAMLHEPSLQQKVYEDMNTWWNTCHFANESGRWAQRDVARYLYSLRFF